MIVGVSPGVAGDRDQAGADQPPVGGCLQLLGQGEGVTVGDRAEAFVFYLQALHDQAPGEAARFWAAQAWLCHGHPLIRSPPAGWFRSAGGPLTNKFYPQWPADASSTGHKFRVTMTTTCPGVYDKGRAALQAATSAASPGSSYSTAAPNAAPDPASFATARGEETMDESQTIYPDARLRQLIRFLRKDKQGWSQATAAAKANLSRERWRQIEVRSAPVPLGTLARMLHALGADSVTLRGMSHPELAEAVKIREQFLSAGGSPFIDPAESHLWETPGLPVVVRRLLVIYLRSLRAEDPIGDLFGLPHLDGQSSSSAQAGSTAPAREPPAGSP